MQIARALLHRPQLLLLDEPTVGLDVRSRAEMLAHIRALVREQGIGVLYATHLFDEIVEGDHLIVLHHGRVLARGTFSDILAQFGARDLHAAFMRLTTEVAS